MPPKRKAETKKTTAKKKKVEVVEAPVESELVEVLKSIQAEKYLPLFQENEIAYRDLPNLKKEDLVEIGIKLGPRNRMLTTFALLGKPKNAEVVDPVTPTSTVPTSTELKTEEKSEEKPKPESTPQVPVRVKATPPGKVNASDCLKIHRAIHSNLGSVTLSDGQIVKVRKSKNGCRAADIFGVTFMEQNKTKSSTYAKRAKQGHKLTWIMTRPKWGMLCDNRVEIDCSLIYHDEEEEKAQQEAEDEDALIAATVRAEEEAAKRAASVRDSKGSESHTLQLSVSFPDYWQSPFTCISRIEAKGQEFDDISKMLSKTIDGKVIVKKVERVQNPLLWQQYYLRRETIRNANKQSPESIYKGVKTKILDPTSNEFYLFHGCNASVVDKIANEGFDERLSSLQGLFGSGIYFAESAAKSRNYTHSSNCAQSGAVYSVGGSKCSCHGSSDIRCIFVARVIVGTPWIRYVATDSSNPMRRPPAKPNGVLYDSVLGEATQYDSQARLAHREFIIYDRTQCFPEYIISFHF